MNGRNFGSLAAVCLVALFLGCANAAHTGGVRITNGEVINIRQAPYIVQLRYGSQAFCGGTLVHPQFVVSAAHCFDDLHYSNVVVVAGANTRTDIGQQRRVVAAEFGRGYTRKNMNGDVAILKLEGPMPLNDVIQTRPLCSRPVPDNQMLQISGWGHMWFKGMASHELRTINVPKLNHATCKANSRYMHQDPVTKSTYSVPITDLMMCAYPSHQDSCQGDSGGPAMYGDELCGIVSFGAGCSPTASSIYTDVYAMRDYIINTIRRM